MRTHRILSRLLAASGFVALLGCAQTTLAARLVDVTVVNRTSGERLTPYRHDGKLYVAGTPGDAYSVELRNRGGERLLTVVAIDGVNVLTGETAAAAQSGYVLDPGRSYGISGWRKSMDDVARFVFTALPDSYAARTGRPDNVGVIGVAVYRERFEPPVVPYAVPLAPQGSERPARRESRALGKSAERDTSADSASSPPPAKTENSAGVLADRAAGSATAAQERQRLGTGHGDREHSPTRWTSFTRAAESPSEVVTIYYDSRRNLVARGIIPAPRYAEPQPFPAGGGFVPDPRS